MEDALLTLLGEVSRAVSAMTLQTKGVSCPWLPCTAAQVEGIRMEEAALGFLGEISQAGCSCPEVSGDSTMR